MIHQHFLNFFSFPCKNFFQLYYDITDALQYLAVEFPKVRKTLLSALTQAAADGRHNVRFTASMLAVALLKGLSLL